MPSAQSQILYRGQTNKSYYLNPRISDRHQPAGPALSEVHRDTIHRKKVML
jgi:hypothetical protein